MVHITCLAHGLHRVSEAIRDHFPKVDLLISNTKKVFLKAPARVNIFKEMCPNISLPPQPIITRWGTWLDAAFYYARNFDKVKEVVNTLNENDARSIQNVQELYNNDSIKNELAVILSNFQCITETIKQIEKSGANLRETFALIQNVQNKLSEGGIAIEFAKLKLMQVLTKNPGYSQIKNICGILNGEANSSNEGIEELSPEEISVFKYAPIVSCDVERSFSKYKATLRDNRKSFIFDNLKMHFIISCYYSFNN